MIDMNYVAKDCCKHFYNFDKEESLKCGLAAHIATEKKFTQEIVDLLHNSSYSKEEYMKCLYALLSLAYIKNIDINEHLVIEPHI